MRSSISGILRSQLALPLPDFWTFRPKDLFDITPIAPEEAISIFLEAGLRPIVLLRQHCCKLLVLLGRKNASVVRKTRTCGMFVLAGRLRLVLAASITAKSVLVSSINSGSFMS